MDSVFNQVMLAATIMGTVWLVIDFWNVGIDWKAMRCRHAERMG